MAVYDIKNVLDMTRPEAAEEQVAGAGGQGGDNITPTYRSPITHM